MTDCEHYGMNNGCNVDCPVLLRHECDLQVSELEDLYLEALRQHFDVEVRIPMTEEESYRYRIGI